MSISLCSVASRWAPNWFSKNSLREGLTRISDAGKGILALYLKPFHRVRRGIEKRIFPNATGNHSKDLLSALVPLAAGSFLFPEQVAVGVAISLLLTPIRGRLSQILHKHFAHPILGELTSDTTLLQGHSFHRSITTPLIEEIACRGILQRMMIWSTGSLGAGVCLSAILFGCMHLNNKRAYSHIQAVNSTFGGLLYGVLNEKLGFLTAVSAHAAHNLATEFQIYWANQN